MFRFEQIYHDIKHLDDISPTTLPEVAKLIYKYYLNPKEKIFFKCLELYYQNKKQRELSVLLNVDQPNLSAKFTKLRKKLQLVADYLLHPEVADVLTLKQKNQYNVVLTDRQYEVLMYLLAGNKAYHISKFLGVSPVAIHQTVVYLKKKLPPDSLPIRFLFSLGSI